MPLARLLRQRAEGNLSPVVVDRHGEVVWLKPNTKGAYALPSLVIPDAFAKLLLRREDRWFYLHPGINPFSLWRAAWGSRGASTITQQLVRNLLGTESRRTTANRMVEALGAIALELHSSKAEILRWYTEAAYFGQRMQGIAAASRHYFSAPPHALTLPQMLSLVAALNQPAERAPGTIRNQQLVEVLARQWDLSLPADFAQALRRSTSSATDEQWRSHEALFELRPYLNSCLAFCPLTVDVGLTVRLRELLRRNLGNPSLATVANGAIVVIATPRDLPFNELLAIVGSPDPAVPRSGYQLNLAIAARPIGSTVKPFLYLRAFANGLRPYTLVDDREYRYDIGTGFAFYPKNYDGKYRGIVTLHQALANSLNVPTVKVLEHIGLAEAVRFLGDGLVWQPPQPLESYELSIALGGLELDLLTLSEAYTALNRAGVRLPLQLSGNGTLPPLPLPAGRTVTAPRRVAPPEAVELVNRILTDRQSGAEQFGLRSNLTIPYRHYAVKTGTSRDFHDSWTIGYTPDFVVGVWLGNSDNTPMDRLSGQAGAGRIWREVMELMLATPYHRGTPFTFKRLAEFTIDGALEYGLPGDDVASVRTALLRDELIVQPHDGDTFLLQPDLRVPLRATTDVLWYVEGNILAEGRSASWQPQRPGVYRIEAKVKKPEPRVAAIRVTVADVE